MAEPETVYRCDCGYCRRVVATQEGDTLVVAVRHDGERHETRIPIDRLTEPSSRGISRMKSVNRSGDQ